MITTLNKIRAKAPCSGGWSKLLKNLGKTSADDEPLSIITILESNGLDDAHWCLRAVDGHEKDMRLYAVWCARQVQNMMPDKRSSATLDVAERYAHGQATDAELAAAWDAARVAAARAASRAAAAGSTASRAAAAGAVAGAAAAWDVAGEAAWDAAAGDAEWAAARDAQAQELRRVCLAIEAAHGIKEQK